MPLNKAICQRCVAEEDCEWSGADEQLWNEKGVVWCGGGPLYVWDLPPEWCEYAMEHLVSNETLDGVPRPSSGVTRPVCERCCMEQRARPWTAEDDAMWRRGVVVCYGRRGKLHAICRKPPERCPYAVEHTVSQRSVETG